jgi:hypothetical protein
VCVIFRVNKEKARNVIFYCTPKPLYTIEDSRRFLIEPTDICRIPIDRIDDDLIWKIAMWGSPRDMDLIHTIQARNPQLRTLLEEYQMSFAEGFKRGNRTKTCEDFIGQPLIDTRKFSPGQSRPEILPKVNFNQFERTVKKNRAIFRSPHLIIKQSHKKSRFLAEVLDFDAVFNHSFLGIHGEEGLLKYFCLIIMSKVFSYYQMMTNRRWLVERDELEFGDILATPISAPNKADITQAISIYNQVIQGKGRITEIDRFAFEQYGLMPYEISLIEDTIEHVYDYFSKKEDSLALRPPDETQLQRYTVILQEVLRNSLGTSLPYSCCIHFGDTPLLVADLNLSGSGQQVFSLNRNKQEMDTLLNKLDEQLLEENSGSLFVKRNVRIYKKDSIHIIKPNQARHWNYSSACRDADEIFADVMKTWETGNE